MAACIQQALIWSHLMHFAEHMFGPIDQALIIGMTIKGCHSNADSDFLLFEISKNDRFITRGLTYFFANFHRLIGRDFHHNGHKGRAAMAKHKVARAQAIGDD